MTTAEEEIWCEVSDDELYNPGKERKGTWQPKAEDILKVFEQLQSKKVLDLHWKCPGRRPPDSDLKEEEETKEEQVKAPLKQEEKKPAIPNEFDFDEEDIGGAKTVITPRRTPGSAPKSQKKEAKMDKILKDMMQQRKLQAAEREARKLASNKSPRTPASPGRARIGSPAGSPRTPNRQSPVRLGAGPNDPISSTPARAPLDIPGSARVTKAELSSITSVASSKPMDTHFNTSQNVQVSQSGTVASYGHQFQSTNTGETTSQALQRGITSSPQTVMKVESIKKEETKENSSTISSEVKQNAPEKMDTS